MLYPHYKNLPILFLIVFGRHRSACWRGYIVVVVGLSLGSRWVSPRNPCPPSNVLASPGDDQICAEKRTVEHRGNNSIQRNICFSGCLTKDDAKLKACPEPFRTEIDFPSKNTPKARPLNAAFCRVQQGYWAMPSHPGWRLESESGVTWNSLIDLH